VDCLSFITDKLTKARSQKIKLDKKHVALNPVFFTNGSDNAFLVWCTVYSSRIYSVLLVDWLNLKVTKENTSRVLNMIKCMSYLAKH